MTSNKTERKTIHLATVETYNRWATTYDTDGNILQALDSFALSQTMIPYLIEALPQKAINSGNELLITDLGCGTGRADLLLLSTLQTRGSGATECLATKGYKTISLTGIDAATGMLDVARGRVPAHSSVGDNIDVRIRYGVWDIHKPEEKIRVLGKPDGKGSRDEIQDADAIISTLVLEHLEIDSYFYAAKALLRPGGLLLVTNMHSDMGNTVFGDPGQYKNQPLPTGAGFVDAESNTKFRAAVDYAHTIEEVVAGGATRGFELVDDRVEELAVEQWMLEQPSSGKFSTENHTPLLGARGRKWVGTKCWYGMLFRLKI